MPLAPIDIHGCILFNFIVIIKIRTNNSHLWSCVSYYQFLALYNKRSLQSNHICKFGKFQCVRKDTSRFDLRYLVNNVRYQNPSRRLNSTALIIPQTKFEAIISRDVGGDRFQVKTRASRQILD